MAVGHYENFPVASWLLPSELRPAVRAIYRFARTADDIADEGAAAPTERLAALNTLDRELDAVSAGASHAWQDLTIAVRKHHLDVKLLRDLLSAFSQDVTTVRYASFESLLDYCRRSANPIGRLLLQLFGRAEPELCRQSDAICTGLQLANFWQDIAVDWCKGRVYLPQEDLTAFNVSEGQIDSAQADRVRGCAHAKAVGRRRSAGPRARGQDRIGAASRCARRPANTRAHRRSRRRCVLAPAAADRA
jgi:squalene synthase HpnC